MADHASRGEAALNAGNPAEAITHYNAALAQSPSVPSYYIQRSTAHQRTSDFASALSDAEIAVVLATKRAKRELITSAQLRRGIALFQLERYGDAGFVFGIVEKMAVEKSKEKNSVSMWKENLKRKMVGLGEDDLAREVTVKEMPDAKALPEPVVAPKPSTTTGADAAPATTAPSQPVAQPKAPTQTPQSKIRHDWYQTNENVYLSLLARGVPKDKAQVDIQPQSVSISFPLVTQSTYDFSLDPLYAAVDTTASTHRILSSKIEVVLKKVQAGFQWPALEGAPLSSGAENGDKSTSESTEAGPVYPTSSRKGPKNWDKIAESFTKPAEKQRKPKLDTADASDPPQGQDDTEAGTKQDNKDQKTPPADDADEDNIYVDDYDDEGDPANAFFKKLYSGADPDTRRAMMKSYQESGGTALSTNWSEVGSKKTEISPPEGMEAKKWEI